MRPILLLLLAPRRLRPAARARTASRARTSPAGAGPQEAAPTGTARPLARRQRRRRRRAFEDPDGAPASLADFRGRPVLVNLWATWCAPCVAEMPTLDGLAGPRGGAAAGADGQPGSGRAREGRGLLRQAGLSQPRDLARPANGADDGAQGRHPADDHPLRRARARGVAGGGDGGLGADGADAGACSLKERPNGLIRQPREARRTLSTRLRSRFRRD